VTVVWAGRIPAEHMGSYAVSKSGIEMYSDILRLEMKKWDVRVSVVEPQRYRTGVCRLFVSLSVVLLQQEGLLFVALNHTFASSGRSRIF